jgi:hypothetical protein
MAASLLSRPRLLGLGVLVLAGAAGVVGFLAGRASVPTPPQAELVAHGAGTRAALQTPQRCRPGAFLEADRILGSAVALAQALPRDTPAGARSELDSILYTGLVQARSEVHCVAGVLTHGYDRAYADTLRKAVALAEQRGLSADVAAVGRDVVQALEYNKPIGR